MGEYDDIPGGDEATLRYTERSCTDVVLFKGFHSNCLTLGGGEAECSAIDWRRETYTCNLFCDDPVEGAFPRSFYAFGDDGIY